MRSGLALALLASCLGFLNADSASDSKLLIRKFESAYRSSRTLQTTFLESYFDNGKLTRSEAGVAYFGRPGKMRWEYESPEPNVFVVDGKWSWFYVPADHTVTRIRAKESADWRTPFALLAGEMKVSRICKSVELDQTAKPLNPAGVVLRCKLRGGDEKRATSTRPNEGLASASADVVLFELNPSTGELLRILALEAGGITVEFRFADWKFGPPVDAAKFRFKPPKGVAIVDGDLGSAGPDIPPKPAQ